MSTAAIGRIAAEAIQSVARRSTNQLSETAVREAHIEIEQAVTTAVAGDMATGKVAVVDVRSGWLSKINITQGIAVVAMLLAYFGIDLDASTQAAIIAAIVAAQAVITWILRTFFSNTITPSSAGV